MGESNMPLEGLDKYKAAFCLLAEKGQDKIKVSKFIDFVKAAFGQTYDDDTMHVFSQGLRPDENGLVDFDSFMKLFSGDSLCPEAKQEVCKAFAQNPDLSGLADWSGALAKLGLSLSKEDVDKVMQQAVKSAVELLKHDFNNSKVLITERDVLFLVLDFIIFNTISNLAYRRNLLVVGAQKLQQPPNEQVSTEDDSSEPSGDEDQPEGLEKAVEKLHLGDSADEKENNTAGDPDTSPTSSKHCPVKAVEEPAAAVEKQG